VERCHQWLVGCYPASNFWLQFLF